MNKKQTMLCLILSCLTAIVLCPAAAGAQTNVQNSSLSRYARGESDYFLNTSKVDILTGDSFSLEVSGATDEEISFKSEDSSVASVDNIEDGKCTILGNAVGTTTITVKVKQKTSFFFMNSTTTLRCKVNVSPVAASIKFKKSTIRLHIGQKKKLGTILRPSITTELPSFNSSNPSVATVNSRGKVRALSPGTTSVTATIQNGMVAQCRIIVKNPAPKKSSGS